mgnify:CR=1 FL=1
MKIIQLLIILSMIIKTDVSFSNLLLVMKMRRELSTNMDCLYLDSDRVDTYNLFRITTTDP